MFLMRPKSLTCYVCGREYGTTSLKIHIPQCKKKWNDQQRKKPKCDRRPPPSAPGGFNNLVGQNKISRNDIDNYNRKAFDNYNE